MEIKTIILNQCVHCSAFSFSRQKLNSRATLTPTLIQYTDRDNYKSFVIFYDIFFSSFPRHVLFLGILFYYSSKRHCHYLCLGLRRRVQVERSRGVNRCQILIGISKSPFFIVLTTFFFKVSFFFIFFFHPIVIFLKSFL